MSLSKYYKDSSSFKREEIKSHIPEEVKGWNPTSKAIPAPFEPGVVSTPSESAVQPSGSANVQSDTAEPFTTAPRTTDPSPSTTDPSSSGPAADEESTKSPAEGSIDLSSYMSIIEAEEKAAAMYQQGLQEGITKAAADFGSSAKALVTSCQLLDSVREKIISNSSSELRDFTLLLAEKIIRFSLKDQDQTIVATIEEALSRAVKSDAFIIYIHPDDHQIISDKAAEFTAGVSGLSSIIIKTDPTIEKGGAKIESENCIIDATISSQLDAIREELRKNNK